MIKKEVCVDAYFDENGICTPKIIYFDLKPYVIDKVLQSKKIASSVYFTDIRYTVKIGSNIRFLYRYKDIWYVVMQN